MDNNGSTAEIYNLSDDDFSKLSIEDIKAKAKELDESNSGKASEPTVNTDEPNEDEETDNNPQENTDAENGDSNADPSDQKDTKEEKEKTEDTEDSPGTIQLDQVTKGSNVKPKAQEAKASKETPSKETKPEESQSNLEVQSKFYDALTAPIKANGTTYTFDDPNKIIELMQKGINYNSKMEAIKHMRGINDILQKNDLTDPAKLAFAIDLHNRKPEAIAKLLQDSGLDTYDLNAEKASEYVNAPLDIESSSVEANFRSVYADNADDENFVNVFTKAQEWDDTSQDIIFNNPEYLTILAGHKVSGVYDKIMEGVNYERDINGVKAPILELYNTIGHRMFGNGQGNGNAQANTQPAKQPVQPKQETVKVTKRVSQDVQNMRKQLAPTATARNQKSATLTSPSDIFKLSDEDFKNIDPALLRQLGGK